MRNLSSCILICFLALVLSGCARSPEPGTVIDEARSTGRTVASMPAADENYFHDMDGGVALTAAEIRGRNTWMVWTGGNDRLWDLLSTTSGGDLDLLKTLSSYPSLKFSRENRWHYFGLVNEPCFEAATGPDPQRFGLWLDKRRADCAPDPFVDETKYPGVRFGARGSASNLALGSYYGVPSGIVGLRLFPNPDFDDAAARRWDPKRYYEDPSYYTSKNLIRPYRVGMSCAFCHVGPNPVKPPADPEHPRWENLSSNVGAQYFRIDRIFNWQADSTSFVFQVLHTSRPGSLDTSLIATDNVNNPRTMNAIYALPARLAQAKRWGKETLDGGSRNNRQFNDFVTDPYLTQFYERETQTVWSPRVLKDGADSVGMLGALNRVYLSIGLFSEEWLLHFNPLIGGKPTTPIQIADNRRNSTYWEATEQQTPAMALFFLRITAPHKLKDAPGGAKYITSDTAALTRGKEVFAERCARCHSSKLPEPAPGLDPNGCSGAGYLECFNRYWVWTKTAEFKSRMRDIVLRDDFLDDNFLSSDVRIPVTLLQTNACSPLASNAIAGNIWDNFSSQTYKELPSVGTITVHQPITGAPRAYAMPAGGRGYTRPASLVSVWSTAPFLLNNSVGRFNSSPSVEARMESFEDSIEQMLWPERRDRDPVLGNAVPGRIDRTTSRSFLRVPAGYLAPELVELLRTVAPSATEIGPDGGIEIGPIPAGTPVNLLANLDLLPAGMNSAQRFEHLTRIVELLVKVNRALKSLPTNASDEEARRVLAPLVDPLLAFSKCPDFVVNRGHYFGTDAAKGEPGLSDADKRALIELLKTF